MTDTQIREFISGMNHAEDAKYTAYEAKSISEYNGCSDTKYSDVFLTKLWNKLSDIYLHYERYEPVSVLLTNSMGAKSMKFAPSNTEIHALNGDFNSYIASKAILQQLKLDWIPLCEFGCMANYFYLDYEKFVSNKYKIVVCTYEDENTYYKSVDNGKEADLPYYLYSFVRGLKFIDKNICLIVPKKVAEEAKVFLLSTVINYTDKKIFIDSTVTDSDYTAYLIKAQ